MAGASSTSSTSSIISLIPTGPQVFINFRGKDVRKGFVSFLVPALKEKNINVFIDEREERGKYLISLFERIGESKIALVIFSERYTESEWCLDELAQIMECVDQHKLKVIPIFYKLDPTEVKHLRGKFGDKFRNLEHKYQREPERFQKWREALAAISQTFAMSLPKSSDKSDRDFVRSIVKEVRKVLPTIFEGTKREIDGDISVATRILTISERTKREIDADISVAARKLTITMHETPNKEAVEVSVLNELYLLNNMNQSPGAICEFKFWVLTRPTGNVFMINARELSIAWSENSDHWTWIPLPDQTPK